MRVDVFLIHDVKSIFIKQVRRSKETAIDGCWLRSKGKKQTISIVSYTERVTLFLNGTDFARRASVGCFSDVSYTYLP